MRRRIVRAAAVLLAVPLAAGGWLARDVLAVAVGHKAKTLCSGVFVSGRAPEAVLAELEVEDLAVLRHIGWSIDPSRRMARSWIGPMTREAAYRDGLGCTLLLDGLTPPALTGSANRTSPPDAAGFAPPDSLPETTDLDAVVSRAFEEPDARARRRTLAVVVLHRGRLVSERYADGLTPDTPLPGWSMTKSVTNALVGILVRQGVLSLDSTQLLPEWRAAGDPRGAIAIDHLLRMSSGLRFDEGMASPRSEVMRMLFQRGDAAGFAAAKPLAHPLGTRWQYSSATTNILARVMRHALQDDEAYLAFPRRALFDPLGMASAVMETDAAGTFIGSSYMYAAARDWARFGQLYLQDGMWAGERVLPDGWVAYTTTPAPADDAGRYGAHVWLHVPGEYASRDRRLPVPAFHATGHEGQFVTVVPSRDVVIVRLGRTRHPDAWDHAAFVRDVLSALDEVSR